MKYIAGMIALLVTFSAFAQDGSKHAERMKKELQLSEQQFVQIKSVNEKFTKQFSELRADESLSKDAKREKAKTLKREHNNQIASVLTAEQKTKWELLRADRKEKKKEVKKHREEDIAALGLTEDQKARMKAEQRSFHSEAKELKREQNLSKDEMKAKRKALHVEHKANLKKILTEDQLAKWQNMKSEHGHRKHRN